jgi:hypothetical protein
LSFFNLDSAPIVEYMMSSFKKKRGRGACVLLVEKEEEGPSVRSGHAPGALAWGNADMPCGAS